MGILSAFRFAFQNVFFTPVLYGVIASLAIFSATWEKGDRLKDQLSDPFRSQQDTFDFIIVGGGSAGSVLAYRLSKYHTVLLLEAGGESHPFQAIPALSLFIPNYPATDWSHKSVTQTTSCLACVDKTYTFSQGKNLGGSGNLNYLIHLRGSPKDFNNWARITGDQKWSYDQVLKDFTISEDFVGTTTDGGAHGVGGPLQIEMPTYIGLANEWNWAGQEMGYQHLDLNGKYEEGFDAVYYPIKRGIRQATYRAFIQPVRHRGSLVIRKFAHVNKILIRDGTNIAYGVQYDRHGKTSNAFANKEVIISAGTLQTPKILMLSGIGDKTMLENCGIPVKSDLPVGKGMQDHISTLLGPFYIKSSKTFSYDDDVSPKSFLQFMQRGTGPLTTSGFQATALLTSNLAKARGQVGWPDIQLTLLGLSPHRLFNSDLAHAFGLKEDILRRFFGDASGKSAFFIVVSVARPESRGEVLIQSTNPYKPLKIDPNYFSDPDHKDINVMIEGIHRALQLTENTTVFQNCEVRLAEKCFPGCEGHVYRSNGYWECYVRFLSITLNDQVGTAQMGYPNSPYAVVDSDLKVMGVPFLRVVDASVMPTIVGANTQAATLMIAEKASSLILQDWADSAVNYDQKSGSPEYGPPPSPVSNQYLPPPTNQGYGTPSLGAESVKTQNQSPNSVVVDDSLGSLTPPGLPGPDQPYNNYDSFDLLRNKGVESIQSINLQGESPDKPSSSPYPSPTPLNVDVSLHLSSVSPYPFPEVGSTALTTPTAEDLFTTPPIYQEIYDPTTPNPSASSSFREGKLFDFENVAPQNFLDNDAATSTAFPTTSEDSVLARGPNGSSLILRKRKKRPLQIPNVTVHPRGHLGLEDTDRTPGIKSTPPTPFSSTSIQPLPTNYVVIKQRRPRLRRKKPIGASPTKNSEQKPENVLEDPESLIETVTTPIPGPSQDPRLRNFIPSLRGKRGHVRSEEKTVELQSDELETTTPTSPFSSRSGDDNTDANNGTGRVQTDDGVEVENELKMVVLEDVELVNKGESRGVGKKRKRKSRESDHPIMPMDMNPLPKIIAAAAAPTINTATRNSRSRISYNSKNYSNLAKNSQSSGKLVSLSSKINSAEERKARMAKFVRPSR